MYVCNRPVIPSHTCMDQKCFANVQPTFTILSLPNPRDIYLTSKFFKVFGPQAHFWFHLAVAFQELKPAL